MAQSVLTGIRNVVVDDTDGKIQYSGAGWFLDQSGDQDGDGNFGPTYKKTLHGTTVDGSFSFPFTGESLSLSPQSLLFTLLLRHLYRGVRHDRYSNQRRHHKSKLGVFRRRDKDCPV